MITLITGAPGAGKSAALVQLLSELAEGRLVYVDGVPDLKIKHFDLPDVSKWPEAVPDGAAVVVDEVQRVWRPRGPGQKVPPDIAALETHRHRGLDFFLVTQQPRLVDANVRALVGRHVHLRDLGFLGRWWYEWPECSESVQWKSAPLKKRYVLPKKVFGLYKSASVHVKPIRSVPWMVAVMAIALVAVVWLAWSAYSSISGRMGDAPTVQVAGSASRAGDPVIGSNLSSARANSPPLTGAALALSFMPRLSTMPASAPVYDELRKARSMPVVVGGMCMNGRCRCLTQQGTDAGLSSDECRQWIDNPPFDPYREPVVQAVAEKRPAADGAADQ